MSGLQKQVLSLYRKCLRAAMRKETHREEAVAFVRGEFHKGAKEVKRSDFRTIEFMLRAGEKQFKMLSKSSATRFSSIQV